MTTRAGMRRSVRFVFSSTSRPDSPGPSDPTTYRSSIWKGRRINTENLYARQPSLGFHFRRAALTPITFSNALLHASGCPSLHLASLSLSLRADDGLRDQPAAQDAGACRAAGEEDAGEGGREDVARSSHATRSESTLTTERARDVLELTFRYLSSSPDRTS